MIALGLCFFTSAIEAVPGRISENTPCSRTRRAMSCVYWEPKSRIRTRSRGIKRVEPSVQAHPAIGEQHRHVVPVAAGDHLGLPDPATWLLHRGDHGWGRLLV